MTAPYATLSDVRAALPRPGGAQNPAWAAKMLHFVPDWPTVPDRRAYLVATATDQVVLDCGATGTISAAIRQAARRYYGVDTVAGLPDCAVVDLDATPEALPVYPDVTVVLASELLEHLANPGRFLTALRAAYPDRPVYLTVPQAGAYEVRNGTHEVVHHDHVAWYSYTTVATLLRRTGYTIERARWYHGPPHRAEGLIVVAR